MCERFEGLVFVCVQRIVGECLMRGTTVLSTHLDIRHLAITKMYAAAGLSRYAVNGLSTN